MVTVLITGGSGLLGKSLKETKLPGYDIYSTWYTNCIGSDYQLDVCNKSQVNYIFNHVKPDIVIHCAANGSVDFAERNYSEARIVNVEGVKNVARAAFNNKAKFVYISSNAVFSGGNPPYDEESKRNPVNKYGLLKLEAEDRVAEIDNWLIIRPFMLYGFQYKNARKNWFTIILDGLMNHREIKLVDDTWWQPTESKSCASAVWQLIEKSGRNEVWNVAADDKVTLYGFGLKLANIWGYKDKHQIMPIRSTDLPGIARRPVDTSYDLTKLHNLGIELPGVEKGLKSLL